MPDHKSKAGEVKKKFERAWLGMKGVSAVGLGLVNNTLGIIISVDSSESTIRAKIPAEIEGVPIKVESIGTLRAQ
jgi:hypothetical protein